MGLDGKYYRDRDGNYYRDRRYLELAINVERLWGILVNEVDLPKHIQDEYLRQYEFSFRKMQQWKKGNIHKMNTRSKSITKPFVCGSC